MKDKRVLRFLAAFVAYNMAANFAHPVTPAFIVERQLDSSMFGVALAAMLSMNFLFSPFWGQLCNYVPTRRIQLIGCLGYAAGQVLFLYARNETMVVFARMFAGAFVGGAFTSFANYLSNIAENQKEREKNLILMVTVQSVFSAVGYFVGGMLGVISTELAFWAQIILLSVSGVLFRLGCVDDTPYKTRPMEPMSLHSANPFRAFGAVGKHMNAMLALIFLTVAVSSIGQNSYEQCFNYFIKDQYGMTSAYNGTFKAVIAIVTLVLNSTVCVTLQKKTDINRSFLWIILACTALISLILVFSGQMLFVAVYILYSGVNVMRLPLLQAMTAARATPESRNNLMGFYQSMNSLGGIFGALFAGLIYKQGPMLPFVLAFWAYALSAVFGGLYVVRYRRERVK